MLILGIESSCDETAASVVRDGKEILSSVVASQDKIHSKFGGVVPELASRQHIATIIPLIKEALKRSHKRLDQIDALAVTKGPGLVGSLLIGLQAGKAVSFAKKIPFVGVNHLDAHLKAIDLTDCKPSYPYIGLVVSGGHTSLYVLQGPSNIRLLGRTRDDAAGEAFDKISKLLELGYPGGIRIEKMARGVVSEIHFPRPLYGKNSLDFSFSGLKTSVVNFCKQYKGRLTNKVKKQIAAGFQEAVVDILVRKLVLALERTRLSQAVICGGVAANQRLREVAETECKKRNFEVFIPPKPLCTDNAAMVAAAGYESLVSGKTDDIRLNATASLEILRH